MRTPIGHCHPSGLRLTCPCAPALSGLRLSSCLLCPRRLRLTPPSLVCRAYAARALPCPLSACAWWHRVARVQAEGARTEEAKGGPEPAEGPRPRTHTPTPVHTHTHNTRAHAHTSHGTGRSAGATPRHTRRGRPAPSAAAVNGPRQERGVRACPRQPPRPAPHPHSTHPSTTHLRWGAGVRGVWEAGDVWGRERV